MNDKTIVGLCAAGLIALAVGIPTCNEIVGNKRANTLKNEILDKAAGPDKRFTLDEKVSLLRSLGYTGPVNEVVDLQVISYRHFYVTHEGRRVWEIPKYKIENYLDREIH